MTAKSFFYACAGIFLLVGAYTMGARNAKASYVDPLIGPIIAASADGNAGASCLTSSGRLWVLRKQLEWPLQTATWMGPFLGPGDAILPVPVNEVAFWAGDAIITRSGEGWIQSRDPETGESPVWISAGVVPDTAVPLTEKTWSDVKERFRDDD